MNEPLEIEDDLDWLIKMVDSLADRVIQLESDIYDMQKRNSEMRRRVDNLESSRSMRMPPF